MTVPIVFCRYLSKAVIREAVIVPESGEHDCIYHRN